MSTARTPALRRLRADAIVATIAAAIRPTGGIVMRRTGIAAVAAIVVAGSVPATAETVKFTGCPVRAAEGCLIVRNGAIVYNISSARPAPRAGYRAIAITADIAGSIGLCFAKPLDHIRWHYIRQWCPAK